FDMWRDYLGLAAVVAALRRSGDATPETPAMPDPGSAPATSDPGSSASPCGFCKHNGEARAVYGGHSLRDAAGRVLCPVLRSYVCPQCGATQERAHTRRFCPLTRHGYTSVYSRSAGAGRAKK
ncbi:NANO3 protein, partial [Halcyon senegalensis]|nr:NANO3 protein [Halcyon senegalensis]